MHPVSQSSSHRLPRLIFILFVMAFASRSEAFGPPRSISSDFLLPSGVAVDGTRVIVADTGHASLKTAPLASLAEPDPGFTTFGLIAGVFNPVGERLGRPVAIASNGSGSIFVVDQAGGEVQRFDWDGTAYAHQAAFLAVPGNTADGLPMRMPSDIAVDGMSNLYVLDGTNKRVLTATAPGYASWTVYASDASWPTCSGLDVTLMGDRVYLACPSDRPILEVPMMGPSVAHGRSGRRNGELYQPQDVAVQASGELVVADTGNNRIELLDPATGAQTHLALSPIISQPSRIALAGADLFVTDVARAQLVAFLDDGMSGANLFVRDYIGDDGTEPSMPLIELSSPDIVVRRAPDVDPVIAERDGLEVAFPSQQILSNSNNYVYIAVRNSGAADALGAVVQLFSASQGSSLSFPDDWHISDFYRTWDSELINEPNHTLPLDRVVAATSAGGSTLPGYRVVGPIVWRPRAPEDTDSWDGRTQLLARLSLVGDSTIDGGGDEAVRLSNNVARRPVVVRQTQPALGVQNTLVVLTRFAGSGDAPATDLVSARMTELDQWLDDVSRGMTRIEPLVVGPYELSKTAAEYAADGQDPLIELTNEVVAAAYADDPGVLDGLITSDESDDISRVVVVVNDAAFAADRATTRAWPYEIDGRQRWLSASIHTIESQLADWAHAYSHQLGLQDLFLYPGITLSPDDRLPTGWDVMSTPAGSTPTPVHPLGISKSLVPWLQSGAGIQFVPRPAGTWNSGMIHLPLHSLWEPGQNAVIALGLSVGVTTLFGEHHFIIIEARNPTMGSADAAVPGAGVLAYRFDRGIQQGSAPILLSDPTPATPVSDAAIAVGTTHTVTGYGADITVVAEHAGDARQGYDVAITYTPPAVTDVGFHLPDESPWSGEELWIDSPENGIADAASAVPGEEEAIANVDNRVYVRVHNYGDAPAYDVEARFSFSDPYHTVGGEGQFTPYDAVLIPVIPAGGFVNASVMWRPTGSDDPHRCIRVTLHRLVNDQNRDNNGVQKNLQIATSARMMTSGSTPPGFEPSEMKSQWRNNSNAPKRIYYRVDGLPAGWKVTLNDVATTVATGDTHINKMIVTPNPSAAVCTRRRIHLTAWTAQADTIAPLGGATLDVAVRRHRRWTQPKVWTEACPKNTKVKGPCRALAVYLQSSTSGTQEVLARFTNDNGYTYFRTLRTDASGKINTRFPVTSGGSWNVVFEASDDGCNASAVFTGLVTVGLKKTKDQDKDGLPDSEELSGDADGDGIDNVDDPDSDNDKIIDGKEKPGDADKDGLPNVIDSDS